eukprot:713913_1
MGFLRRKSKKSKKDDSTKSKFGLFKPKKTTKITYVEQPIPSAESNVTHYTTISLADVSIMANDTMATQDIQGGNESLLYPTAAVKHTPSFDQRIRETEASLQDQIRMATSEEERTNVQLTTTSGVLVFDGLEAGSDDDESLAEVIRKEREDRMLQSHAAPDGDGGPKTGFLVAPKNYDPVASGFYTPKDKNSMSGSRSKSWYDEDESDGVSKSIANSRSDNDIAKISMSLSGDSQWGKNDTASMGDNSRTSVSTMSMRRDPKDNISGGSVEVVINRKSHLNKIK